VCCAAAEEPGEAPARGVCASWGLRKGLEPEMNRPVRSGAAVGEVESNATRREVWQLGPSG
jgi:hypothetical protein